jgi:short-subunit dehydrogenase
MKKLAVVTGGTKGIGKAIIEKFASEGFDIITCSRNESDLKDLKGEIGKKYPTVELNFQQADLSNRGQIDDFISFVKNTGRVNVLVNNTGYFIPGEVLTEKEGSLESMINTNLYSAYHLTRGLVPEMKKRGSAHIFNICSIASIIAYPNGGSYTISKFALYGMTKVLREELKKFDVRVTAVLPGATLTASWEGVDLPEERFIKASDVAESVWSAYSLSQNSVVEEIIIRPQLGDID